MQLCPRNTQRHRPCYICSNRSYHMLCIAMWPNNDHNNTSFGFLQHFRLEFGTGRQMCLQSFVPLVIWCCWTGGRKSIWPVKAGWWGVGIVICLQRGANDVHMVQQMPLTTNHLCFSKIQNALCFWYQLIQVILEKLLNECCCWDRQTDWQCSGIAMLCRCQRHNTALRKSSLPCDINLCMQDLTLITSSYQCKVTKSMDTLLQMPQHTTSRLTE